MADHHDNTFSKLSDDVVLKILFQLEDDPRNWARLSCVSRKFLSLISTVCCKSKCISNFPSLTADLLSLSSTSSPSPPGRWASLYKIAVCCPGLRHAGVLLDNSDFGLLPELGPDERYKHTTTITIVDENCRNHECYPTVVDETDPCNNTNKGKCRSVVVVDASVQPDPQFNEGEARNNNNKGERCCCSGVGSGVGVDVVVPTQPDPRFNEGQDRVGTRGSREPETWTLYDDLYLDTMHDNSEATSSSSTTTSTMSTTATPMDSVTIGDAEEVEKEIAVWSENESKKRKISFRLLRSHLASGVWNLSREQGNKLLASRFRDDCLYICDWPGCVHMEDNRNYMLFRGVFKNFKRSIVWRTINDGNSSKIDLNCAFCSCKETWDLHSAFCLKRGFGFHDDWEPVVRAYVCENGHVSGAWTDLPLYS